MIKSDITYTINDCDEPNKVLVQYTCGELTATLVFECNQLAAVANTLDYIALEGARTIASSIRDSELEPSLPTIEDIKNDLIGQSRTYTPLEISALEDLPRVSQVADLTGLVLEILQHHGVVFKEPAGALNWPR